MGVPLRKKKLFSNVREKVLMDTKPGGGGLKALVVGPLRKDFFCEAIKNKLFKYIWHLGSEISKISDVDIFFKSMELMLL